MWRCKINCYVYIVQILLQGIVEEILMILKKESSHKVKAQALSTLLRLSKQIKENVASNLRVISVAKQVKL